MLLFLLLVEVTDVHVISHFFKNKLCFGSRGREQENGDEMVQVHLNACSSALSEDTCPCWISRSVIEEVEEAEETCFHRPAPLPHSTLATLGNSKQNSFYFLNFVTVSKWTLEGCRECPCCSSRYWQPTYRLTWVNTGLLFHADQIREMLAPKVNFLRRVWKPCCNRKGFIAAAVAAVVRWTLWQAQRFRDGCALLLLSSHCADLQWNACRKRIAAQAEHHSGKWEAWQGFGKNPWLHYIHSVLSSP